MRFAIPGRANKFVPQAARNLLNQRLPNAPAPDCLKCKSAMDDVRPFHIEPVTHAIYKIRCLVRCPACATPHIGHRDIGIDRRTTRFLEQEFERYDEAKHGETLRNVNSRIQAKREKFDKIQASPVTDHSSEAATTGEAGQAIDVASTAPELPGQSQAAA